MKKRWIIVLAISITLSFTLIYSNFINSPAEEIHYNGNDIEVNSETIASDDIEKEYQQSKNLGFSNLEVSKDDIANSLINEKLLLQRADKIGIIVSDEEQENTFNNFLTNSKLSEEELNTQLESTGSNLEEFKLELKNYLIISKLIDKEVKPNEITLSDKEFNEFTQDDLDLQNVDFLINDELLAMKKQEAMQKYIDNLKKGADIN